MAVARHPVLVFDGECGFCTNAARWAAKGWPSGEAEAVAWQRLGEGGLAELGLRPEQAQEAAWWVDTDGRLARGHRAVAEALRAGSGWRAIAGRLSLLPPLSWTAALVYDITARNRYRLPGSSSACRTG